MTHPPTQWWYQLHHHGD